MSRAIRLSKIHALNWYGYRDTLPVAGNLVLAGVTGSGKSILMDLLMLVLVGPEKSRHHFNRSATGSRSDRTIKGYCLLDTKREENGQAQYFHDKGITTYIAAEFTWPDGSKVETWGLRFEFRGASDSDGITTPFYCPSSLERDDFLAISPEDGKARTRTLIDFKSFLEERGGRVFSSPREYLRDMANGSHLNFNQDVLSRLLPSAMSFTNLKSFDEFCRHYILPSESVAVDDVVASYRDFRSYETELVSMRSQLERLMRIRELSEQHAQSQNDGDVATYLAAETAWQHALSEVDDCEGRLAVIQKSVAADERRFNQLSEWIATSNNELEQLGSLWNESPDGNLYRQLLARKEELEPKVKRLRQMSESIDVELRLRVVQARDWANEIRKVANDPSIDVSNFDQAVRRLEESSYGENTNALSMLDNAANTTLQLLRERFSAELKSLRQLKEEKSVLAAEISSLEHGLPLVPQPLLLALRDALPATPGMYSARALRELCEVEDEDWRGAIEVAFTEKFAVVVHEDHYEEALQILHELGPADISKQGTPAQTLINPKYAKSGDYVAEKGSLASKIRTSDPIARAVVNEWYGKIICVRSLEEMKSEIAAILSDGLMANGSTVERSRHYDGLPFIGEKGIKQSLHVKRSKAEHIDAQIRRIEPIEREIERLARERLEKIPEFTTVSEDLVRLESLPRYEKDFRDLQENLQAIDSEAFRELEVQIKAKKAEITNWDKEKLAIVGKGGAAQVQRAERNLAEKKESESKLEDRFSKVKLTIDISRHLERYRTWKSEMAERYPMADQQSKEFGIEQTKAEKKAIETLGDLKVALLDFKRAFQPKFDDFPEEGLDCSAYEQVLLRIEKANIPEFERKSALERKRWNSLFRTQVLSRMQQALNNVENIISLLNHQLKRPIGNDRYRITRTANPEFKFYRKLIELNALHHEDELFFQGLGEELKAALDDFLQILVTSSSSPAAARLLDYRQYFDYDLLVSDVRDPDSKSVSVDKQSGKMSGGENQSPYFVAILASYLHAYNRHETRWKQPSLALVPIDEAFSKLSGERIQDCLKAMAELDLQGMFSMSSGNIPYAFSLCDQLIVVWKKEDRRGARVGTRNVPSILFKDSNEGREWMKKNQL